VTATADTPVSAGPTLPGARRPLGPGAITAIGVVLALLTTALGVLGVRDGLVRAGALPGSPWLDALVRGLDGLRPQWWAVPVGLGSVVLGIWLVVASVRPRPRTAIGLRSRTGVELKRRAVGRLAVRAAEEVDGVLSARARVGRRQIDVATTVTGEQTQIADDVRRAVEDRLAALQPAPRIRVRARTEGEA
jgi:hypothetical protein